MDAQSPISPSRFFDASLRGPQPLQEAVVKNTFLSFDVPRMLSGSDLFECKRRLSCPDSPLTRSPPSSSTLNNAFNGDLWKTEEGDESLGLASSRVFNWFVANDEHSSDSGMSSLAADEDKYCNESADEYNEESTCLGSMVASSLMMSAHDGWSISSHDQEVESPIMPLQNSSFPPPKRNLCPLCYRIHAPLLTMKLVMWSDVEEDCGWKQSKSRVYRDCSCDASQKRLGKFDRGESSALDWEHPSCPESCGV